MSCCVRFSKALVLVAGWVLLAATAQAATVERLNVDHRDKAYIVTARIGIDAPAKAAYAAATDFSRLPDYSPMIQSTRRIGDDEIASRMRLCVLWYCKTVDQVMRYRLDPPQRIDMSVVPGQGDLSAGDAHWRFVAAGKGATELCFHARLVPDFWVPPLIGPWAIARALRQQVETTATAIERLAERRGPGNDKTQS